MGDFTEVLLKSFTRYFIPGLITLAVAVYLPLSFFTNGKILGNLNLFEAVHVLVFSIVLGYLLDSFGAYGWTLSYRGYKRERSELTNKLNTLLPSTISNDPDQYLAQLWLCNEEVYNRLFVERAEWVMILESSCALLLAGTVFTITPVIVLILSRDFKYWAFLIALILIFLSYISSRKGIQRMRAHNMKVIQAIQNLVGKPNISQAKPSGREVKK